MSSFCKLGRILSKLATNTSVDDFHYLCIHAFYKLCKCGVGFALCNVCDILEEKWSSGVQYFWHPIYVCYFKMTIRYYFAFRQMVSMYVLFNDIVSFIEGFCYCLVSAGLLSINF